MIKLNRHTSVEVTLTAEFGGVIKTADPDGMLEVGLVPFLKGDRGEPGSSASVSGTTGNIAQVGNDGGIYVPAPTLSTEHW